MNPPPPPAILPQYNNTSGSLNIRWTAIHLHPKYSGTCLPKKVRPLAIPLPLDAHGSRVHSAADETWLIAVAVPAKRPARRDSHVALGASIWPFHLPLPSSSSILVFHPFSSSPSPVAVSSPVLLLSLLLPPLVSPAFSSRRLHLSLSLLLTVTPAI